MERILELSLFSIPESLVIVRLALSLTGKSVSMRKFILMGMTLGVVSNFLRVTTGSYIASVMVYWLILVTVLTVSVTGNKFDFAIAGTLTISMYLMIEFLNVNLLQLLFNIDLSVLSSKQGIRFAWFIPQLLAASLLSYLVSKFKLIISL